MRALQERKQGLQAPQPENGAESGATEAPRVKLGEGGFYDTDIYDGSKNKFAGYVTSIAATDEPDVS